MSDLQNAARQFADMLKDAEERQAGHLGEIGTGIRVEGESARRRIRTQLARIDETIRKAFAEIGLAREEIVTILEEIEAMEASVINEIDGIRTVALAPAQQQIDHKETDNG